MADTKISALGQLTDVASLDELPVVDKSDTTQAASGSTKRITLSDLRIATAFDQRSTLDSTVVLPSSEDLAIQEVLAVGSGTVEIPATSTFLINDAVDSRPKRLVFYPEDYGAKGDNTTDDTAALQRCIDAAMKVGGKVQLAPTTYLVSSAPRTDRVGNCILSIIDSSDNMRSLIIEGANLGGDVDSAYKNTPIVKRSIIRTNYASGTYANGPATTLAAQLTAGATSASLTSAASWPEAGYFVCQSEVVKYTSKTGNTLNNLVRGRCATTDATHVISTALTVTYGPPSVIGGGTEEQLATVPASMTPLIPHEWCGTVYLRGFGVQVPLNPTIAGIDGLTFGGMETREMSVFAGTGGDAVSAPTNTWAFGYRHPNRWMGGVNKNIRSWAFQMYCAHAFLHEDHHLCDQGGAWRCVVDYGFSNTGDGIYPIRLVYGMAEQCKNNISGYECFLGVTTLNRDLYLHRSVLQLELGAGAWALSARLNDANNKLKGDLVIHEFNGLSVTGPDSGQSITGGQNVKISWGRDGIPPVASAATITVPPGQDWCQVTGTTNITSITASYPGRKITLQFTGTNAGTGVTDGSNLKLASNFIYTPDDTISLICDGTTWYETGRSVN